MLASVSLETVRYSKTDMLRLTVISLRNPVLYTSPLGKIGDLRPILIRICMLAEGTAGTETSGSGMGDAFGTTILSVHASYSRQYERGMVDEGRREGRRRVFFVKMILWMC